MASLDATTGRERKLSVGALILVIIGYLVIVQVPGLVLTRNLDTEYAAPTSLNELWRMISVGVFLSLVFVYLVVAVLRWWRPVFVDHQPTQRWVRWLAIIMLVSIAAGTNWSGLADRGLAFSVALLGTTLMVGFAEEGMFRGIAVTTFRNNNYPEAKVALWSTVLFGLAHGTNVFVEGPKTALQVVVTIAAGFFFYLLRRWSGGLLVAALLHGAWDFGVVSAAVVPDENYAGAALFILADIVMLVIVLVHRHRIDPPTVAATAAS